MGRARRIRKQFKALKKKDPKSVVREGELPKQKKKGKRGKGQK